MLIRTVWLLAVLLPSFHLVSGQDDIPPSIDEVIRKADHGPQVLRRDGRSAQDDVVRDGSDMSMTQTQFRRLYAGVQGRNDGNMAATPWTDGIIPYKITPGVFDNDQLAWIRQAMDDWEAVSCVRFERMREEEDRPYYVQVYGGSACSAQLGMSTKGQNVELADGCFWRGTITHEFGHTLGLVHEHQRTERDQYLRVNYYAADEFSVAQLTKFAEGSDDKMGLGYDYLSIMHYGKNAFNDREKGMQTLFPRDRTKTDVIGHAVKPSYIDAKLINLMYRCSDRCRRPRRCRPGCFLTANCSCLCERDFRVICEDRKPDCRAKADEGDCLFSEIYMHTYCRKSCNLCWDDPSKEPYLRACADSDDQCNRLQQEGMCEFDAEYMEIHCPIACGLCNVHDGNSYRIRGPCRDMNATCYDLARNGQCDRHPETMLVDCRRSCDFCPEDINRPMPRPGRCEDRDSVCTYWKNVGKCITHRQAISSRCPGSCETCDVDIGIPSGCRDEDELCLGWAFNGECESNPGFMNRSCSLSCGTCPGLTPLDLSAIRNDIHYMCSVWGREECEKRFGFMRVHCRETCREEIIRYGDCYDTEYACVNWANDGECFTNPSWMARKCRKSCVCGEEARNRPTPAPGMDKHRKCFDWAATDQCDENRDWMLENCPQSCHRCAVDPATCTTIPPELRCEDRDDRCPDWAERGYCAKDGVWMRENCKRSCTNCSGGGGGNPTSPPLDPNCVNNDRNCEAWARVRENCNEVYMRRNCRRACHLC